MEEKRVWLYGHDSESKAKVVKDYPYGFNRVSTISFWVDSHVTRGDRLCSRTIDPVSGRLNKVKVGTYCLLVLLYTEELDGREYVRWQEISPYEEVGVLREIVLSYGEDRLTEYQLKHYRERLGILSKDVDEFSGELKKAYRVLWEKGFGGLPGRGLRITFNRIDGVSVMEIYDAMRGLDQEKLRKLYAEDSDGDKGIVRIFVRGGIMLTSISEETYLELKSRDINVIKEN